MTAFPADSQYLPALRRAAALLEASGQAEQSVALAEEIGERYPEDPSTSNVFLRAARTCTDQLREP